MFLFSFYLKNDKRQESKLQKKCFLRKTYSFLQISVIKIETSIVSIKMLVIDQFNSTRFQC